MKHEEPTRLTDARITVLMCTLAALIATFAGLGLARGVQPLSEADALVELMQRRPRAHIDRKEDPKERQLRLLSLGVSMIYVAEEWTRGEGSRFAGTRNQLIALLVTAGYWESRFASNVHRGECEKWECDGGRARSVYQLHSVSGGGLLPDERWRKITGANPASDAIATWGAADVLVKGWNGCHRRHGVAGVFAVYMRGRCQGPYQTKMRARFYLKILSEVNRSLNSVAD